MVVRKENSSPSMIQPCTVVISRANFAKQCNCGSSHGCRSFDKLQNCRKLTIPGMHHFSSQPSFLRYVRPILPSTFATGMRLKYPRKYVSWCAKVDNSAANVNINLSKQFPVKFLHPGSVPSLGVYHDPTQKAEEGREKSNHSHHVGDTAP